MESAEDLATVERAIELLTQAGARQLASEQESEDYE
jgi:hypothetical protein